MNSARASFPVSSAAQWTRQCFPASPGLPASPLLLPLLAPRPLHHRGLLKSCSPFWAQFPGLTPVKESTASPGPRAWGTGHWTLLCPVGTAPASGIGGGQTISQALPNVRFFERQWKLPLSEAQDPTYLLPSHRCSRGQAPLGGWVAGTRTDHGSLIHPSNM